MILKRKEIRKVLFLLIFIFGFQLLSANCFFLKLTELVSQIEYPTLAFENEIETDIYFSIDSQRIKLDSANNLNYQSLFQNLINQIIQMEDFINCEDIPNSFIISFQLSEFDTIYFQNNIITKQAKSISNILSPSKETAGYYENSRMVFKKKDWEFDFKIKGGKKTVFKYKFIHEENPYKSDDELIEGFFFEIPKGLKEFEYKDEKLERIKMYYEKICFVNCSGEFVTSGYLKGRLDGDDWIIQFQIGNKNFENKFKRIIP